MYLATEDKYGKANSSLLTSYRKSGLTMTVNWNPTAVTPPARCRHGS